MKGALIGPFVAMITYYVTSVSETEANEPGSSLIGRTHFFFETQGIVVKGGGNCVYARMEELRCAV